MQDPVTEVVGKSLVSHLLTVVGFLLAVFAIARLLRAKKQPANTIAWLFGILLVPYVGVPLYLLFGGRKLARLAASKGPLSPRLPLACPASHSIHPTAQTMCTNGAIAPVGGNHVRLLTNGEETYAELERLILGARHTIHIMTFILGHDDTGRRIVELLARRAADGSGIKVRLLLDALGCWFTSGHFIKPIIDAGGEVVKFMPMVPLSSRGSANLRNHRKIAVFDHHTALVGGHNIARDYMGPEPWPKRFTDLGAIISGPAATILDEIFLADWTFASKRPLPPLALSPPHAELDLRQALRPEGKSEVQIVANGPDVPGDPLYDGIVSMVQEAKRSLWIITPYFIPDEVLLRSLEVKARAGRDVTIILPARSNHPITDYARRPFLRQLMAAGVRVLAYQPGMLHSKAIIVDDQFALIGSANMDMRSLFVNFEIGAMLYSQEDARALRAWAGELIRECEPLTPDKIRRRRILGNIAEDISRLLAPLL
ncbi:cardiolipin synthase [Geminisphaera colitermitum]|uniref:cardiolipin synthase n=1 Tax=Geminisphaera colitermitum TaxID=1148786 RepID=UPI0001965532|nr:cardiolipin synthase [Geminisphaera colitermitum]